MVDLAEVAAAVGRLHGVEDERAADEPLSAAVEHRHQQVAVVRRLRPKPPDCNPI